MGLFKNTILGTGAAIVSVATAYAADLPSRKAAPVDYVRICDAYGRGFFYIPGTDTCVRFGGLVRADYAFVATQNVFNGITAGGVPVLSVRDDAQHINGWEARARLTFDARTQTSWGVVQTAARPRMARTTGDVGGGTGDARTAEATGASPTLEAAFIRFAGFTFGATRDNFAMMPSLTYGAGHWGSFANGAKQIAYTHSFGGGFSATIALQDLLDTQATTYQVNGSVPGTPRYAYNSLPNLVGRLDLQQGWGAVSIAGAVAQVSGSNNNLGAFANEFSQKETVWAATIGATFNLPMLAQGSKLYLTAAYADGMTEYTTNWTSVKTSAYRRDVGGFTMNHPSVVFEG
ncbi:MAG: porin, partial [Beijerinckiaceae bacterium]|nr:porin [Beijerinckiaceae bacterium]